MDFPSWLDAKRGRTVRLAEHFGISIGAVSQWRVNGVPRERLLEVVALSGGELALADLVAPGAPAIPTQPMEVRDAA